MKDGERTAAAASTFEVAQKIAEEEGGIPRRRLLAARRGGGEHTATTLIIDVFSPGAAAAGGILSLPPPGPPSPKGKPPLSPSISERFFFPSSPPLLLQIPPPFYSPDAVFLKEKKASFLPFLCARAEIKAVSAGQPFHLAGKPFFPPSLGHWRFAAREEEGRGEGGSFIIYGLYFPTGLRLLGLIWHFRGIILAGLAISFC